MAIRVLDATVAAQIAAGEVVERPASVARELIENALDAGARRIGVDVRGGGVRELRVQDDGGGIRAAEVELAFQRHATSKLTSADDLWAIGTLGFRGEALPSIASVAQVVCVSRSAEEQVGVELRVAGGEVQGRAPVGAPVGTSVSVRNLFYNTPVRREFLRSEAGETGLVAATVTQYALAYPEVRFSLTLDGRLALQTSGDGDLRGVVIELYGLDVARQLLAVAGGQGEGAGRVAVAGLVSPPGLTRASRSGLHLFVNRRVVQPRGALAIVVEEAYHTLLARGRHPLAVLNIGVHPAAVDVNIHPTKSEVKFRDGPGVLGALGRAVRDALLAGGAPLWDSGGGEALDVAQRRFELRRLGGWRPPDAPPSEGLGAGALWGPREPAAGVGAEPAGAAPGWEGDAPAGERGGGLAGIVVLGQSGLRYIVADSPEGLVLIDQHAAHERALAERLAEGPVEAEALDPPLLVELEERAAAALLALGGERATGGVVAEDFGGALRVRSLPAGLPRGRAAAALRDAARAAGQGAGRAALAAALACQMAAQPGQPLTEAEMRGIVEGLARCRSPWEGAHGRPTAALVGRGVIERQFGGDG